jgi:hypothetical protein
MTSLIADTTKQYETRILASGGTNNYTISISTRRASVACPECKPCPKCPPTTPTVVYIGTSTDTYVNIWSDGVDYGRWIDILSVKKYASKCSSRNNFLVSSGTWNTSQCKSVLGTVQQDLYELSFSTPTIWK